MIVLACMFMTLPQHTLSHSSHALPAPNPNPAHTGNDLRLKRSTEKITPNDAPRVLLMSRVLRQWSHYDRPVSTLSLYAMRKLFAETVPTFSFRSASLRGRPGRLGGGTEAALAEVASAIVGKKVGLGRKGD